MLDRPRPIHLTLATLVAAGLLASGCGGGGGGGDGVASLDEGGAGGESAQSDEAAAEEELLDWVQCMRDEGIDISDPTRDEDGNLVINGPGIHIGGGGASLRTGGPPPGDRDSGERPIDPGAMEAATEACGHPPPLGGELSEEQRQEMEEDALAFAECMRDEGVEDFPDPDFSGSGPGGMPQTAEERDEPGGDGGEPETRIALGPFGEIDMDDPEVAAAFEQCQDLMGGRRGGPGGPGGPGAPGGSGGSDEGAGG